MNLRKSIRFILPFIFLSSMIFAQSISVSGSSSATLSAGSSTATVRYYITYYDYSGQTLSLHYKVDGGSMVPQYPDGSGANVPSYVDIDLSQGSHTIEFGLLCYDWNYYQWATADTKNKSTTVKFKVFVENIFGDGSVKINGVTKSSGDYVLVKGGDNINIEAVEQSYGGNDYVWNTSAYNTSDWRREPYSGGSNYFSSSKSTSYSVQSSDNYTTLVAGLRFNCYVTFQNNLPGMGNDGVIKVGTTQYNSPTSSFTVVEENPKAATAVNQVIDGIYFTFDEWSTSSGTMTTTFYPDETPLTYTANFNAKPTNTYRSLSFNYGEYGEDIELTWNAHPLDNNGITKYDIYRKVKINGVVGPENNIGTVTANGSGSYSFADNMYQVSDETYTLCLYDVRAYYSPSSTYADPYFQMIYGETRLDIENNDSPEPENVAVEAEEEVKEITLGNFPNPFNPTTNINYTLAEDGYVSLKVYNALGQKVATLVNEVKPAGNYNASFNASSLPSGVYIYTLQTNGQLSTRKMLLMK